MEFKQLTDTQSLEAFAALTQKHLTISFPLDYLRKSKVVALIDDQKKICGGYVMVLTGPFRVIESLPTFSRQKHEWLNKRLESAFELTGLWLCPSVVGRINVTLFWLKLYFDIVTLKKKFFVYAYGLNKPALGKIYRVLGPQVLFRGRTLVQPGMAAPEDESVEMASVARLGLLPFLKPQLLLKKMLFTRTLSQNAAYQQVLREYEERFNF